MPAKRTEKTSTKAPAARKPALRRKRAPKVTPENIAVRAFYLHLEGGADAQENWLRAERELIEA